jgi:4-amino-4-deoxy-L-arabinose transferase-like glycosyltransferase
MKNINKILLILIIALAAFLRLYKVDSYPALNADEAAIGYNAFSLLETGKDEHGNPWPIHFQSFNDYKPGFYVYLVMPFVKVLGLNEWSVRLPNVLLGLLSVYLIYLLARELYNKDEGLLIKSDLFPVSAAFLLAISPWHIHFSRGGWEVNTATFLITLGFYLLLKYLKGKNIAVLAFSVLSFALSLYTYHAARIIVPLLLFGTALFYFKEIKKNIKQLLVAAIVGLVLVFPLVRDLTKGEIVSRAAGVGLFADVGPIEKTNEQRMEHHGYTSVFLHNKVVNYGLTFLKNWSAHYHGLFLFVSGDVIQRNAVPETGQMYLFEIITVLVGMIFVCRKLNMSSKPFCLLLWWLLIAPVPAALTFQSPHALRAQNMIIPLTLISALGVSMLIDFAVKRKRLVKNVTLFLFGALVAWNFGRYLHMYWLHMSKEYPFSSQYGVKELVDYIDSRDKEYKNIVVTNKYDQPYILFLFYTKYPPHTFQNEHILTPRDKYGFSTVDRYSNYVFKSIDWDKDKLLYPDSLIIGSNEEIPDEANITKRIYGSNGYLYFKIVSN